MKKILVSLIAVLALVPTVAAANIKTLGGSSIDDQVFATSTGSLSPHIRIVTAGNTHTFQWDGSPWTIAQGGTGATSFSSGAIPFVSAGVFAENVAQLFWDTVGNVLNIGGIPSVAAKLTVMGSGNLLNLANASGMSVFRVDSSGQVTGANGMNITSGCYAVNGVCLTSGGGTPPAGDANDDFETYAVDVLNNSTGGNGWTSNWLGNSRFVVQSAVVAQGVKAVKAGPFQLSPTFFQQIILRRTFAAKTSGSIHFALQNDANSSSMVNFSSGGNLAISIAKRDSGPTPGPNWYVTSGTSSIAFQTYTPGTFETVDIEFDTATDQFRVSIGGAPFGPWYAFADSVKDIDSFTLSTNGPGNVYFDDIRIEQ